MIGPVSTPASTTNSVAPVTLTPCASASRGAVHAREGRQQRRVGVDVAAAERGQERRADQPHEAGRDDQVGVVRGDRVGERRVPLVAARRSRRPRSTNVGTPCACGPVEGRDAVAVGTHGHHRGAVRRRRLPRRAGPAGWCRCPRRARPVARGFVGTAAVSSRGQTIAAVRRGLSGRRGGTARAASGEDGRHDHRRRCCGGQGDPPRRRGRCAPADLVRPARSTRRRARRAPGR